MSLRPSNALFLGMAATGIGGWLHASGLMSLHQPRSTAPTSAASMVDGAHALRALPLYFEVNRGQANAEVRYLARAGGYNLFLTAAEAVLTMRTVRAPGTAAPRHGQRLPPGAGSAPPATLRLRLIGAARQPRITGLDPQPGKVNYLLGSDPTRWRRSVPTYARVKYHDVYPGVDLIYYGSPRELEYDFIVAPGADPGRIVLEFAGAERLELNAAGDLILHTADGAVTQRAPRLYQAINGARRIIPGRYVLRDDPGKRSTSRVTFQVGVYEPRHPLVIDPVLVYSSYLGGEGNEWVFDAAVDDAGSIYLTGQTTSLRFPTANSPQPVFGGGSQDGFVAKLNAAGTRLEYATYLGGSDFDRPRRLEVDAEGNLYVVGHTDSPDFPTAGARQWVIGGSSDGFVTKLDPTGSRLIYSTFLGGNSLDQCLDVALVAGSVIVTGQTYSANFPTVNARQRRIGGSGDVFVTRLDATGTGLIYSTYLGGSRLEWGSGIAADAQENAYIVGQTQSANFPTLNARQRFKGDGSALLNDAFVAKVDVSGQIVYSTYLGGSGDDGGWRIAVDSSGSVTIMGRTSSARTFPLERPLQRVYGGGSADAFVAKLDESGSRLVYSTFLGGSGDENPVTPGLAVDSSGSAYVAGYTTSSDFPTANALQPTYGGNGDGFLAKLNAVGSALVYSTYLGGAGIDEMYGVEVDAVGSVCVAGASDSAGLATTDAVQRNLAGGNDLFVTRIADVTMDVQPGALPNVISLRSQESLPVALLSNPSFSAATVDVASVTLGDPRLPARRAPSGSALQDVDGDGDLDRVLVFRIFDLVSSAVLDASSTQVVLRGQTVVGGTVIAGDSVSIVP